MPAARQGRIPYGTLCAYAIAVSSPKAVIRTASGVYICALVFIQLTFALLFIVTITLSSKFHSSYLNQAKVQYIAFYHSSQKKKEFLWSEL